MYAAGMAPPKIERFVSISDLAAPKKRRKGQLDRFVSKTIFADNGCWEWVGTKNDDGNRFRVIETEIVRSHGGTVWMAPEGVVYEVKEGVKWL